jgi:hypothetical protein
MPTLISPGVSVTVIDQSQYLPATTGSVPLVVFATASNKVSGTDTSVAVMTTSANAGKLKEVTSQRDLVTLYGNPIFYTDNGTPLQGYELNEYGLFAAYSALGASNRVYCLRADIDLASLEGSATRPTSSVANGSYWLDTSATDWGIYEFNATTGSFSLVEPIVIIDSSNISNGYPLQTLGQIGSYAVNALQLPDTPNTVFQFFYKNYLNTWVALGSAAWRMSLPAVVGTASPDTLTAGNTFTITIPGGGADTTTTITVPAGPNNTVAKVKDAINNLGYKDLSASVNSAGRLQIYSYDGMVIAAGTGTVLADLGIEAGEYNSPAFEYGTAAQQPLWQQGQDVPRPSGSIWMKVGNSGNGFNPRMLVFNSTTGLWTSRNVNLALNDTQATNDLDPTGGKAIPAGTLYAQYDSVDVTGPIYYWRRLTTGQTVVTGSVINPEFNSGPYYLTVYTSQANSTSYLGPYTVTINDNSTVADVADAWTTAAIPYTIASVSTDGALQLTHTLGGEIKISDTVYATGISNGFLATAGLVAGDDEGVKFDGVKGRQITTAAQTSTTGAGSGLTLSVSMSGSQLQYVIDAIASAGSGYAVGDIVSWDGDSVGLGGSSPDNDFAVEVTAVNGSGGVLKVVLSNTATNAPNYTFYTLLSNWVEFTYEANDSAPVNPPAQNQNWFYSQITNQVDIMVKTSTGWTGYKNVPDFDSNGFPLPSGSNETDPNGPQFSASAPTTQSDGTELVYGDLWIDTSDLDNYPLINRWQSINGEDQWVLIDNSDNTSGSGVLFQDARWSGTGAVDPIEDPIPTTKSMLTSDYTDLDCPDPGLSPTGILLFNTRRSGNNVKQYKSNYFTVSAYGDLVDVYSNSANYVPGDRVLFSQTFYVCIKATTGNDPDDTTYWLPMATGTWYSVSGLQSNGAPYMGRKAQRNMVVEALNSVIASNTAIRDEDNFFNLIATPNYPECQAAMIELNQARNDTGYIIGDTPLRLPEDATAIREWATNAAGVSSTGEDGLVNRNEYMGLFYPSGTAVDLSGNNVVVPASFMMLRTFLRNDTIAYPWFAAAGTLRGQIGNATSIGYLDAATGEFVATKTRIGIRDVCYENQINPLVFFTGNGLLNFGNKNSLDTQSALDRTNVSRLVAYIRRQLTIAGRPFVFEPNDAITRAGIAGVVQSLMIDLVAKRGLYDYLVVCDESNNTPERIDRNELWVDVAIEPVKAAEFIYIPVRILNTGEIGNQA